MAKNTDKNLEKDEVFERLTDAISKVFKEYNINKHVLCFQAEDKVMVHFSMNAYEAAKMIKSTQQILLDTITKEIT